jgi:BirA family biotin operon repressor/biotin-[acetyl-CoA-carboxylase] ligase
MELFQLEQTLAGLPLGPLYYYQQTGSTNTQAARWAEAGAPDLTLVVADEQTAGRGRQGRRWLTPPGAALAFSLVLLPKAGTFNLTHLTALGALAVVEALRDLCQLEAEIKWPNDVLLERRKVGGVLVEASWQGECLINAILGIGVNVARAAVPEGTELIYPATCVEANLGRTVDRQELLRAVLSHLLDWRPRLGSAEFLHAWEERLAFRNEWVRVLPGTSLTQAPDFEEGQILGLEADGALRLCNRAGWTLIFRTGEVSLRPVEAPEAVT